MRIKKKYKILIVLLVLVPGLFWGGISLNGKLEWKLAEETIALGAFPVQIGVINAIVTPCFPSCQTPSGLAACCGPPTGLCMTIVPTNGTFETTCPFYSAVTGLSVGGTGGNMAILSNIAMGRAGLASGGQFIYGGTTNNMSLSAGGISNSVLASSAGCFNCYAKGESVWKRKLAAAKEMMIAAFKD